MMELEEGKKRKKEIKDYVKDGVEIAEDLMDAVEQGIGISASPATFWLIFLKNTYSGNGFSGFKSNNTASVSAQAKASGLSPPIASGPVLVGSYKGWDIYQVPDGQYQGFQGGWGGRSTPECATIQACKDMIDTMAGAVF